jgi:hypothetical protein
LIELRLSLFFFFFAEMLDYDVPSDDEDYEPARDSRSFGTGSIGAPTPRPSGVGASSPAPESLRGDNNYDSGGDQRYDEDGRNGGRDDDDDDDDREEDDEEGGSGYDSDLANEINKGLEAMDKSEDEDEEDSGDGLFGGSSDDDDDDEEEEQGQQEAIDPAEVEARKRIKLLAEEMGDLDKAIHSKENELAKAANPIFKVSPFPPTRPCVVFRKADFDGFVSFKETFRGDDQEVDGRSRFETCSTHCRSERIGQETRGKFTLSFETFINSSS